MTFAPSTALNVLSIDSPNSNIIHNDAFHSISQFDHVANIFYTKLVF